MGTWKFTLDGEMLHRMIDNEQTTQILERLVFDLKVFVSRMKGKEVYHDFKDLLELVECDVAEQVDNDDEETLSEVINERLVELYDICDMWRVWITR